MDGSGFLFLNKIPFSSKCDWSEFCCEYAGVVGIPLGIGGQNEMNE